MARKMTSATPAYDARCEALNVAAIRDTISPSLRWWRRTAGEIMKKAKGQGESAKIQQLDSSTNHTVRTVTSPQQAVPSDGWVACMDLVDMLPRPNEAVKQAQERKDRVLTTSRFPSAPGLRSYKCRT